MDQFYTVKDLKKKKQKPSDDFLSGLSFLNFWDILTRFFLLCGLFLNSFR